MPNEEPQALIKMQNEFYKENDTIFDSEEKPNNNFKNFRFILMQFEKIKKKNNFLLII